MEYKTVPLEIKAVGDDGVVEGHYSIFGNVDDGQDISHPGSFNKTIQERGGRVKVFRFHDWSIPIGPAGGGFNGGNGNVLKEDGTGLFARYKISLESFWGKDTWVLIKDQIVSEGSYGYEAVKTDWGEDGVRHLREQKLFEVSPVPLGMNPLTTINAVKAGAMKPHAAFEAFLAITEEIKAGRVLSSANVRRVREALAAVESLTDVLNDLLAAAEPSDPDTGKAYSALLNRRLRAAELALARFEA